MPYRERIDLAYEAWNDANGALSIRRAGEDYGVAYSTLNGQGAKTIVQNVGKSAILAMADSALLERTNSDLLAIVQRKEAKKKRRKGLYTDARVINQEILDERREAWDWDTEWRRTR